MPPDPRSPRLVRADRIHAAPGEVDSPASAAPDAMLVRGGRVVALGAYRELAGAAPTATELDLRGYTLTPGLTDAHIHPVEWALARRTVDLRRATSPADAARTVAAAATPASAATAGGAAEGWVRGIGWQPHGWPEPPHRRHLDALLPDRPVLLQSHDLHSLWANSAALRAAGITRDSGDPDGGRIERDVDGEPTGVLRDNAMPLLYDAAPAPSDGDRLDALLEGQAALHRLGVTGIHTVEPDTLSLFERARADRRLRLRVLHHLPLSSLDAAIAVGLRSGFGGRWIRIGGIKMFLDGALGSRTAWLCEPYEGSDDRGVSTLEPDAFRAAVQRAAAAGLAATVHAIGDAALRLALEVLGDPGLAADPGAGRAGPRLRHRIEHAQLAAPAQLRDPVWRRVVASVQPSHLMTDWPAAGQEWGRRASGAFAFASLERAGAVLALGSDAPVEPPDPREGLYAAVARRDREGGPEGGWYPEERIGVARALAGYTVGAACAAGDRRQGRLEPGSFADAVAWDRDPLAVPVGELLGMRPCVTMVDGETLSNDG